MTGTLLYLRSRRVPLALAGAVGGTAVIWALYLAFAKDRDATPLVVVLTVLLMVSALAPTLAGPDANLDRTASLRWPRRRAAHVLAGGVIVLAVLLATLHTGARFGPAGLVVRDAAGLLGLTALCTSVVGAARSWFLPVGWTTIAAVYPQGGTWGAVATWQGQPTDSRAATAMAAAFALGGLLAYAIAGPARTDPAE
ncbi:hypothetical protein [Micromonospora sp. HUAS LYJ1]|uniref:hypothetical protein n=1 Tax=Micromonospora sp. HUAS LYJ1 TaxID=3061626 RepID=UPI0026727214|nr:hypothetical protein [Micromonospora sp. HUAS LYJ1]WKU05767.1 hypothetical protein Q2K16_01470 [Micromonospora sp. HUAS LYJ1]